MFQFATLQTMAELMITKCCQIVQRSIWFQVDGWNLCDIALAIKIRGVSNTTDFNKLDEVDKLAILTKIGSQEMDCLNPGSRSKRNKAIKKVNQQILDFVSSECWCI